MGAPIRPAHRPAERLSVGPNDRPSDRSRPLGVRLVIAVTTLGLLLTGCSSSEEEADAPSGAASGAPSSGPPALRTDAAPGVVSGRLDRQAGRRVTRRATEVVDAWLDAAYVGGDYPRAEFRDAYPHFSRGARRDARRDAALMSNAAIGERVTSVRATKRRLRVDVLAVKRRAVGLTARFVLEMRVTGEDLSKAERRQRVAGSLFLTFRDGGWTVFGYDVNRGRA